MNGKEASEILFVDIIILKVNRPVKWKDTKSTDQNQGWVGKWVKVLTAQA